MFRNPISFLNLTGLADFCELYASGWTLLEALAAATCASSPQSFWPAANLDNPGARARKPFVIFYVEQRGRSGSSARYGSPQPQQDRCWGSLPSRNFQISCRREPKRVPSVHNDLSLIFLPTPNVPEAVIALEFRETLWHSRSALSKNERWTNRRSVRIQTCIDRGDL